MIAITTNNSISVKPRRGVVFRSVDMAVACLSGVKGLPGDGATPRGFATGSARFPADLAACRSEALLHGRSKFDTSQTFTVASRLPEYNRLPSGLNARLLTRPV
jgi:hypothetical protein